MIMRFLHKLFSNHNDRVLRNMYKTVDDINKMESVIEKLSNKQLSSKTLEFRERIHQGETLDNILPEAFAVVRESSKRVFGMRHFNVQLLGGIILNKHCIAEMRTGEGKTLTATLPAYLNALTGKGVHIVTVNDYLAERDAKNNSPLFEFLGLEVGINLSGISSNIKRSAYAADITYGTNNEYGFDYLRDNMVFSVEEKVQRKLHYAIIDEVDSILIDEARTPLVISSPVENSPGIYHHINKLIPFLIRQDKEDSENFQGTGHFSVDEKYRQINLTERGLILIEELLVKAGMMKSGESLYSPNNIILMYHINAALRAHVLFTKDVDYIINNGEIIIVDEHTGRIMPGRRWSDGLHQAIEAKENVIIQNENQTLASITFQNYFRLYEKLAGMTGTAITEAIEFNAIYKLNTIVVPTNRPMIRKELPDLVYITEKEKIAAIIKDIKICVKRRQPVLVGTISIEKSELISYELNKIGISHKVLNAKLHAKEADIIAQAGQPGAVTIATNMAGRGTDIVLGGNWQAEVSALKIPTKEKIACIKKKWQQRHNLVLSVGGLHIIGTERHESRRIDNQLRGRSGRQGDIGSSRFYLSMQDTLMRIFTSNKIAEIMRKLGIKSGEAIEHPWVTKAIANAQKKVESRNFDIRRQLLEYDDVANDQRKAIYTQRNELLVLPDISHIINNIRKDVLKNVINNYTPYSLTEEEWNITGLESLLKSDFSLSIKIDQWLNIESHSSKEDLYQFVLNTMIHQYRCKENIIGQTVMRNLEKNIMLQTLDSLWKEHLAAMEYLRQGIHLRGYAQKDPKQEYKRESYKFFSTMLESLKYEVISILTTLKLHPSEKEVTIENQKYKDVIDQEQLHDNILNKENSNIKKVLKQKVGRNNLCPCGSGNKFKHCHGRITHK